MSSVKWWCSQQAFPRSAIFTSKFKDTSCTGSWKCAMFFFPHEDRIAVFNSPQPFLEHTFLHQDPSHWGKPGTRDKCQTKWWNCRKLTVLLLSELESVSSPLQCSSSSVSSTLCPLQSSEDPWLPCGRFVICNACFVFFIFQSLEDPWLPCAWAIKSRLFLLSL